MAGFLPDSHLLQLRGIFAFPILRLYEYFRQVFSIIATSGDPHLRNFAIFEGASVVGGFLPDPHRYNYEGFSLFQFYDFTSIFRKVFPIITTSDDPHFLNFRYFEGASVAPDFFQIPTHYKYQGFRFSNFATLRVFSEKYFP